MFVKLFILSFFVSAVAWSQNSGFQKGRFDKWLSSLEQTMISDSDATQVVHTLVENSDSSRVAAFNLQLLGKLYGAQAPVFQQLRTAFKDIEDGIGSVEKWSDLKNSKNEKAAIQAFSDLLAKNQWSTNGTSPLIRKFRQDLNAVNWMSADEDRRFLAGRLRGELEKILKTQFDFSTLEEGNGLHEFRRKIRAFSMQVRVLGSFFKFKPADVCPASELRGIVSQPIASDKYAVLTNVPTEGRSCEITQCYFVDLADVTGKIGKLKDKTESLISNAGLDATPPEIKAEAEQIAAQLSAHGSIPGLIEDLNNCGSN